MGEEGTKGCHIHGTAIIVMAINHWRPFRGLFQGPSFGEHGKRFCAARVEENVLFFFPSGRVQRGLKIVGFGGKWLTRVSVSFSVSRFGESVLDVACRKSTGQRLIVQWAWLSAKTKRPETPEPDRNRPKMGGMRRR